MRAHRPSANFTNSAAGRVGDDHLGEVGPQQHLVGFSGRGIATDQAVPVEVPEIAQLADGQRGEPGRGGPGILLRL